MTVAVTLTGLVLTGCSANSTDTSGKTNAPSPATSPSKKVEAPADLIGEWKQTNSKSADSYQSATITADAIEANWVSDGGETTSLYWAGSYTAPTKAGEFTWESNNDTSKTEGSMLASPSPTKTFSYSDGVVSYQVSMLGTTTTVKLSRK